MFLSVLLILMLALPIAAVAIVVVRYRRASTAERRRTERAQAVVKDVRRLTWTGDESHWFAITFTVTPEGRPPFESRIKVTLKKSAAPHAGAQMEVAYDPRHLNNLAFLNLPRQHGDPH